MPSNPVVPEVIIENDPIRQCTITIRLLYYTVLSSVCCLRAQRDLRRDVRRAATLRRVDHRAGRRRRQLLRDRQGGGRGVCDPRDLRDLRNCD